MPTKKELDSNKSTSNFNPILGGYYRNGALISEDTRGFWWGSEAPDNIDRYGLGYNNSNLYSFGDGLRRVGMYIRCVSEEKTVLDLTYMQDIARGIAKTIK